VYLPAKTTPLPSATPAPAETMTVAAKKLYLQLAELTAATIMRRTRLGDSPLHRAAKNAIIPAIPSAFLTIELFMEKNVAGDTPLHIAVRNGYLYQVPSQFLTSETLSVYDAVGETSLHMAANNGQFCRIPRTVLTSELLGLPTRNQVANTVLHLLAQARRLNHIPPHYITSESWNCPNGDGLTPRDMYERACELINSKNQSEPWRTKPLTDKQANKRFTREVCT
jgi:ankyrin repeat protein